MSIRCKIFISKCDFPSREHEALLTQAVDDTEHGECKGREDHLELDTPYMFIMSDHKKKDVSYEAVIMSNLQSEIVKMLSSMVTTTVRRGS